MLSPFLGPEGFRGLIIVSLSVGIRPYRMKADNLKVQSLLTKIFNNPSLVALVHTFLEKKLRVVCNCIAASDFPRASRRKKYILIENTWSVTACQSVLSEYEPWVTIVCKTQISIQIGRTSTCEVTYNCA